MAATNVNNNGRHLFHILQVTTCKKHLASEGMPCYIINPDTQSTQLFGACGARIKRAGFVGKVSPISMTIRAPGGRGSRPGAPRNRTPNS